MPVSPDGWNTSTLKKVEQIVQDTLYTLGTDWMYTAIVQAAFKGPEPVWSQDDWSFVPVPLVSEDPASAKHRSSTLGGDRSSANLTVQTPAIRARLHCSTVQSLSLSNSSGNDDVYFYTNHLYTDMSYLLGHGNFTTRFTAQNDRIWCCFESTGNTRYIPAVIAYWTENWWVSGRNGTTGNFTVKWVQGVVLGGDDPGLGLFHEPPAIQALNCMPTFESSRAEVTVEPKTGAIQEYRILNTPLREDIAWSDYFQWHIPSGYSRSEESGYVAPMDTNYFYNVDVTIRCVWR
jgi:hypothetical protein